MPADPRPESRVHPTVEACVSRSFCDATFAEVERLRRERDRYREALEFIAAHCGDDARPEDNAVQIAREALSAEAGKR